MWSQGLTLATTPRTMAMGLMAGMMADYREISQEYGKEGIRTAILINAGAAVALLSQASELVKQHLTGAVLTSMIFWSLGVALAAFTWLLAFSSTRFVDKSEREKDKERQFLDLSNSYLSAAIYVVLASLVCFLLGCVALAIGFLCAG